VRRFGDREADRPGVLMNGAFEVDTGRFGPRRSIDFFPSSAARVAFGVNRVDVSGA